MDIKKISKKLAKEQVVDRVNPKTTGSKWKKLRNICGVTSAVLFLAVSPVFPVALPAGVAAWLTFGGSVLGIVAGGAHLDKSRR
jgi:small-conductance mechanosensitive channel